MGEMRKEIVETLGTQFVLALEGMIGEKWCASFHSDSSPGQDGLLCWSQRFNFHKDSLLQIATTELVWREIGTKALIAVGIEDPAANDVRATYLELLTQALSGVARFLSGKTGEEVTLDSGEEFAQPASAGPFECIRLTSPSGVAVDIFVKVESAVASTLVRPEPASVEVKQPLQIAAAAGAGGVSSSTPPPSMELLLDVEMPVSVSFGRTQLALKEVIKLSTGSIVELNRTISEPVEVIVNNCVVARGEVVVIEGNYGVRIQQIISRVERLQSVD